MIIHPIMGWASGCGNAGSEVITFREGEGQKKKKKKERKAFCLAGVGFFFPIKFTTTLKILPTLSLCYKLLNLRGLEHDSTSWCSQAHKRRLRRRGMTSPATQTFFLFVCLLSALSLTKPCSLPRGGVGEWVRRDIEHPFWARIFEEDGRLWPRHTWLCWEESGKVFGKPRTQHAPPPRQRRGVKKGPQKTV